MLKLSDFAVMHGVTPRGARKLLQTYEKDLEGHFERKGQNGTWIDETAQEFLRSKMIKNPVILYDEEAFPLISENKDLKKENEKLKDKISEAFEKLAEATTHNAELQLQLTETRLLAAGKAEAERRASQVEEALTAMTERATTAEDVAASAIEEADKAKAEAAELQERLQAAEAEAERLKSRGFWARVFNKG